MLDLSRSFHVGMAVSDIDSARQQLGVSLGLDWTPIRVFDPLPFWTPERGEHDVIVHACYSRQGPEHLELCQGTGDFYHPDQKPDARHLGVWVDDLPAETERLLSNGWQVLAAGAKPDDGFGAICYLQPPMGGLTIELVAIDLKPVIDEWLAATE